MTVGKQKLNLAVLVVNGKSSTFWDKLWLEPCLENIIEHAEKPESIKVFVWNHDSEQDANIKKLAERWGSLVSVYTEDLYDVKGLSSPTKKWKNAAANPLNWHGFHAHRTGLQILYWIATDAYDVQTIVTFDTDSWPIKKGWDTLFDKMLDTKKIVGVWRNEMLSAVEPFIHPSGLALRVEEIERERLRFDTWPVGRGEDSLSHLSRYLFSVYGKPCIGKLKRTNGKNLHPVFGGIYGDLIYHHHAGTRFTNQLSMMFKGSADRGETKANNTKLAEEITMRVFCDHDNYIQELRGHK